MIVIFDTNVIAQAVFWPRSNARKSLSGLAKRRFQTAINEAILEEYAATLTKLQASLGENTSVSAALAWIAAKSLHVEPAFLSGKLSRDPEDNLFVATAVAARASFVVSQDRDLLALKKPFGISMVTPVQLVREFRL